ncbi:MAG: hypothetical protein ACO3WN_08590 [Burkholderiaceae bacterium]
MLNVTLLFINLVALLVALGQRASAEASGMQWLASTNWAGLAQDFWLLTQNDQLHSHTVIAAWLVISLLWVFATAFDAWLRRRRATQASSITDGKDQAREPKIVSAETTSDSEQGVAGPSVAPVQAAPSPKAAGIAAAALTDPALGPLLSDLEKQVSSLPPGAQQEIDQLRRALEALVTKP